MKEKNVRMARKLTVSALFIALAAVLSEIKIVTLPMGGGVTALSMLPVILIPVMFGAGWGFFSCATYAAVQLLFGLDSALAAPTQAGAVGSIFFDYLLAYSALGIVGFFARGKKPTIILGAALAILARYAMNIIATCVVWGVFVPAEYGLLEYGILYNSYVVIEGAAVCIVLAILLNNKGFSKIIK